MSNNQIVINHPKSPTWTRLLLVAVVTICAIVPIVNAYFVFIDGKGMHIAIFISILIFWLPGFFILRTLLWNSFGAEIIELTKDKVIYKTDYKYFKGGKRVIRNQGISFQILSDESNPNLGRLIIKNNLNEEIETILQVERKELEYWIDEINLFL